MIKDIEYLKSKISEFNDSDFGEPIYSPAPENMPEVVLPVGMHPRIGFTKKRLPKMLFGVEDSDNKYAYKEVMRLSDIECDGVMRDFENHDLTNNARVVNCEVHNILLAKAFRYAAFADEKYGYEAIYALKNYLHTFDIRIDEAFGEGVRQYYEYNIHITMVEMMRLVACVYDWCYPLLTDKDKKHFVGAVTNKCITRLEFPKYPPDRTGGITGHQSGGLFFGGWMPFVLAIYDEYPEYYNVIFDLVLNMSVPGQNHLLAAGFHGQGIAYGASRLASLLIGECWYSYMYDGEKHLFSDKVHEACLTFLKGIRPDGETMRIGDDFLQGRRFCHLIICSLLGSGLYKDPVLKGFAAHETDDFSIFWLNGMNPVDVLLFNDAELGKRPLSDLPLCTYYKEPAGVIFSKTAHNDKNAGMVYMKVGNSSTANHEHRDCGDFQIYHKGMLISSSGAYSNYGSYHDYAYYKQTISKNSILVYNPNMKDNGLWKYSGGQRIDDVSVTGAIDNLEDWLKSPNYNRAKTLYGGFKTEKDSSGKEKFIYSYIAGDLTAAYDEETVSEVKRHMVCFDTGNKVNPMAFIIFDKITSKDPSYKKSLLFHTQNTPLITDYKGKVCSVVTNLMSRLYIQSLLSEVDYTFVGGRGEEFLVGDEHVSCFFPERFEGLNSVYNTESGLGRLEISPKSKEKENSFLTVMYVGPHTDCSPYLNLDSNILQPFREAHEIQGENVLGCIILDNAVIFSKDGEYITDSFTVEHSHDVTRYLVFGLKSGIWEDSNGTKYDVDDQSHMADIKPSEQGIFKLKYLG